MSDKIETTRQIVDLRRRLAITLDHIATLRLRAQVAESYGLNAVAHRTRSSIERLERDIVRYSDRLEAFGTA